MNEGKSEVTQRQSHSAKTTLGVAIMMQGMLRIKRKVPGSSSLVRCDGPSVCSARSFTRKELHWNCCWMRTMTWAFPLNPFSDWWVRKVKTSQKSIKFLTDIGESEKCFPQSWTFQPEKVIIHSGYQKSWSETSNFWPTNFFQLIIQSGFSHE